jgi:hypothetical protein
LVALTASLPGLPIAAVTLTFVPVCA